MRGPMSDAHTATIQTGPVPYVTQRAGTYRCPACGCVVSPQRVAAITVAQNDCVYAHGAVAR
jgi:hypothetical protein